MKITVAGWGKNLINNRLNVGPWITEMLVLCGKLQNYFERVHRKFIAPQNFQASCVVENGVFVGWEDMCNVYIQKVGIHLFELARWTAEIGAAWLGVDSVAAGVAANAGRVVGTFVFFVVEEDDLSVIQCLYNILLIHIQHEYTEKV